MNELPLNHKASRRTPVPITPPRAQMMKEISSVPDKKRTKKTTTKPARKTKAKRQARDKRPARATTTKKQASLWKAISEIRMIHVNHCRCGADLTQLHKCQSEKIREAYIRVRNELAELNLPYAHRLSAVIVRAIPQHSLVDRDDTQTAAAYGIIQAIDRYFPGNRSNATFHTFAYQRVRGEIVDDTRRLQDMPCDIAALRRASYPLIEGLTHALGRFPTLDLIIENLTAHDIAECTDPLIFAYVFNQSTYDSEGEEISIDNNSVISQLRRNDSSSGRNSSLSDFDVFSIIEDEMIRDIVWQYYKLGMSHKEIAMVGSYSISYVSAQRLAGERLIRDYFGTAAEMKDVIYAR